MRPTRRSATLLGAVIAALSLGLTACGDDEEVPTLPPPSLEQWQGRVELFCSDGIQEATALPLPQSSEEVPLDSQTRADIVATVRDAVLPLARPEGTEAEVDAWLAQLTEDANLLTKIATTAETEGDYVTLLGQLDETAGQLAAELDLPTCTEFANVIARTP